MKSSRILSFSFFYIFFLLQEHLALGANVTTTTTAKYQIECTMCPSCDNPCQPDPSPPPPSPSPPPPSPPPASSSPNCPSPPSCSPPRSKSSSSRTSVLHYSTLGVALVSLLSSCFAAYVVIMRTVKKNNNNNVPKPDSGTGRREISGNIVPPGWEMYLKESDIRDVPLDLERAEIRVPAGLEIDLEAKIWGNIVPAGFVPAGLEIDLEAKIWGNNVPAGLEKIWNRIRDGKYSIMDG